VLHEVGALGILDQIRLLEWSAGARSNPQVISTTPAPLLPRVRAGAFIDTLYYRLNTVYMEVTGPDGTA
jgi:transcriptional regulator of acetoin/glycerol metabolism